MQMFVMYINRNIFFVEILMIYVNIFRVYGSYRIEITNDSPAIIGSNLTFKAVLYDDDKLASGSFKFDWQDWTSARHQRSIETEYPNDTFIVNYKSTDFVAPGTHIMQLNVHKFIYFMYYPIVYNETTFNLTDFLNGFLSITQNKTIRDTQYVSTKVQLNLKVNLKASDVGYLNESAVHVYTYWFFDCNYYGITNNYELLKNYTKAEQVHIMEAIIVADFSPDNSTNNNHSNAVELGQKKVVHKRGLSEVNLLTNSADVRAKLNAQLHQVAMNYRRKIGLDESDPTVCNNTEISVGSNDVYGYVRRRIFTKDPISNLKVSGNNWIQRSELLQLNVVCNGTASFRYCLLFKDGIYNATGNETCRHYDIINECSFPASRLFINSDLDKHTVLIIIMNDVTKIVYPVTINIYKATKHAQLSVIVVPVVFTLVAVVLIIFGVAYHIQNRSRFIVEIADFNFAGPEYADMEYKTFKERLRESVMNALTRAPIPGGSSGAPSTTSHDGAGEHPPSDWPPTSSKSNNKYDAMA